MEPVDLLPYEEKAVPPFFYAFWLSYIVSGFNYVLPFLRLQNHKESVFFIVKKCKYVIGEIYLVVYLAPETCEAAYRAAVKPFVDPVC